MGTVKNQLFQDHHILPKVETGKNHFFQDHHILQIWKLLKITYFKTTTSSQIVETVKNQLFQDHHTLPK